VTKIFFLWIWAKQGHKTNRPKLFIYDPIANVDKENISSPHVSCILSNLPFLPLLKNVGTHFLDFFFILDVISIETAWHMTHVFRKISKFKLEKLRKMQIEILEDKKELWG
jgi:hypothetical protein